MAEIVAASSDAPDSAAALIYATDPGVWDYLFAGDRSAFDLFASALWRAPGNSYSFDTAFEIRAAEGNRLALQVAYPGAIEPALTRAVTSVASDVLGSQQLAGLVERANWIEYLTPAIPPDDWYLHFLSVEPAARGRGFGRALLEHFAVRAGAAGARALHLDVYVENPAVTLYLASGYEIVVETRFPGKPGLPNHYRMVKRL